VNATVCPINPPGHDWEAGLACRWCDATRTPSEAVLSGLASVRGWSREAARTVRDAYRTEVLNEAAEAIDVKQDEYEAEELKRFGHLDHETVLQRDAVRESAALLRQMAAGEEATPTAATATPEPDFFEPGRTYTEPGDITDWRFRCDAITTHPGTGERTALGWKHFRGEWSECSYDEDEWEIHQIADAIGQAGEGRG
jgi:hypothetical protein